MTHRRRRLTRALTAVAASVALAATGLGAGATVVAAPAGAASKVMLSTPKSLGGWGVKGLDVTTSPVVGWKSNVTALAEWNGRIYVGGMFTAVARDGVTQAAQRYLAAFDRDTGTWVSSFRPTLDGGVWDLVVTPSGRLVVGGYFSTVNGATHRALVALDPATGAVDPTWKASGAVTTGRAGVRTLHLMGSWIYVGGNLNSVRGGTGTDVGTVRGKNLFKVKVSNGRPNASFHPVMGTAVWQVYASPAGDRVYAAGRFGTVNGVKKEVLAVLRPSNGALVGGLDKVVPTYDCRPRCSTIPYSEAVYETKNRAFVVATPIEHGLQQLRRSTLARTFSHYTAASPTDPKSGGGDFQAIAETNGVVYAACHCWKKDYSRAYKTLHPGRAPVSWSRYSTITGIGAYDATTFVKLDSFQPTAYGDHGDGTWQLFVDSTGCLWAGGDITHAPGGVWLGGFAKFCRT